MLTRHTFVLSVFTIALILAGCGGSPEPEKVVIKKEKPAPSVEESADAGNLGASHQQKTAQAQKEEMAKVNTPSGESAHPAVSEDAPEIAAKEGFRVDKAVDGMGRGTLHFIVPEEWESSQPSSSMRVGQYTLPGEAGPAELAVFGPMGGSVQMNIDRWIGQVEQADGSSSKDKAKQEKMKGDQFEFTLLDVTGVYVGMQMPGAPAEDAQENYRLLASIVETPSGPWFFKAIGPHDTPEKWVEGFKELNNSIQMQVGAPAAAGGSGTAH